MARLLVDSGADIDKADKDGDTPLHVASQQGHKEVVKALLDLGADATLARIEGITPLQTAKEYNHLEIVALLEAALRDL
jgi:ankyrin repeat protein